MPPVHDYTVAAQFDSMTNASDTLFDGNPEKWPTFENHLIRETKNAIIEWSKDIFSFKITGQDPSLNFLESWFDIPENMIELLIEDIKNMKLVKSARSIQNYSN
jgi:hypothetical protein